MRVGFFSDIHGNIVAFDECLPRLRRLCPDGVYFLGDAVGYLPAGQPVLDGLEGGEIPCQKGNHEAMLLGEAPIPESARDAYRLDDTASGLSQQTIEFVSAWPDRREVELAGRRILLVHGSPEDPLFGYVYPDSDLTRYASLPYDLIVTANTHRPLVTRLGDRLFVNPGSVGLPRDVGNLASFCVYDAASHDAVVYRVAFEVERVRQLFKGRIHDSVDAVLRRSESHPLGELLP